MKSLFATVMVMMLSCLLNFGLIKAAYADVKAEYNYKNCPSIYAERDNVVDTGWKGYYIKFVAPDDGTYSITFKDIACYGCLTKERPVSGSVSLKILKDINDRELSNIFIEYEDTSVDSISLCSECTWMNKNRIDGDVYEALPKRIVNVQMKKDDILYFQFDFSSSCTMGIKIDFFNNGYSEARKAVGISTLNDEVVLNTFYYDVIKEYESKDINLDCIKCEEKLNFGKTISYPFYLSEKSDIKIYFNKISGSGGKCAIFNSNNEKVFEENISNVPWYATLTTNLEKGDYKLKVSTAKKWINEPSFEYSLELSLNKRESGNDLKEGVTGEILEEDYSDVEKEYDLINVSEHKLEVDGELNYNKTCVYPFKLTWDSEMKVSFSNNTYGNGKFAVFDSNGQVEYEEKISTYFVEKEYTFNLKKGNYELKMCGLDGNSVFKYDAEVFDAETDYEDDLDVDWDDDDWDDDDWDWEDEEYELKYDFIKIEVGKNKKNKVIGHYTSNWNSKNRKVARVNKQGVITGVSPGTTIIIATVGKQKLKCKVKVISNVPLYSDIIKVAKKLANEKCITYQTINKGKHVRLEGVMSYAIWTDDVETDLYGRNGIFVPYIDIKNNKGYAVISYGIKCNINHYSAYRMGDDTFDTFQFLNDTRRVTFGLSNIRSNEKYQYNNGLYKGIFKADVNISSNKYQNKDDMKTLEKILSGNKVRIKIYDSYNTFTYAYVWYNKEYCKEGKKVFDIYEKLLKI